MATNCLTYNNAGLMYQKDSNYDMYKSRKQKSPAGYISISLMILGHSFFSVHFAQSRCGLNPELNRISYLNILVFSWVLSLLSNMTFGFLTFETGETD